MVISLSAPAGTLTAASSVQVLDPTAAYDTRTCSARLSLARVKAMAAVPLAAPVTPVTAGAAGLPAGTMPVLSDSTCK